MCGIAGFFQVDGTQPPDRELIARMVQMIEHRGPDEFGAYLDDKCVLGQARLSIIDLSGGKQPMCNEDGSIWISFNGEIYNYVELRPELEQLGHVFKTRSDTEVIIHAYEQWGKDCLSRFNGQFAFAIYDSNRQSLFISRDRLGIRPAFWTQCNGRFYFASEIKSIFCDPQVPRRLDMKGLDEIFTWWTTAPPRTAFEGINELEAGTWLEIREGEITTDRYWTMTFPEQFDRNRSAASWAEELRELLIDSVRLRLRADVPVGAYLSGGLDSSATTALIRHFTDTRVETFSIAFADEAYDESGYQKQMADHLGTNHHQVLCKYQDIAENFPKVIWHTERPIVRTAPTPLYMLSRLVRDNDFKVVLTGEGSDEILGGYDIFKETLIRAFWAKDPDSTWRPSILKRLYPTLPVDASKAGAYLAAFYRKGLSDDDKYYYSHMPRMATATMIKKFFSAETKAAIDGYDSTNAFGNKLPANFDKWHHLSRAQFVEARSLLAGYILSSQGDRMCAANSIEGRFPFLDHRLAEFAAKVPPWHKILGLNEKFILKKAMRPEIPKDILDRVKQPYMAPDSNSFVQADSPDYVGELLSEAAVSKTGVFNPASVAKLRAKCTKLKDKHLSFRDNMSFVAVLSTQLTAHHYVEDFKPPRAAGREAFTIWHDCSKLAAR